MDKITPIENYTSKYIDLLNHLHNDTSILTTLKVSILCSQRNQSSQINENEPSSIGIHCQNCFTPWEQGNFIVKTRKCQNGNGKLKKNYRTGKSSFIKACQVCSGVTTSEFIKTKTLCKSTEKISKCSTIKDFKSKTKEKQFKQEKRVIKKKKKTLYAGLNPLVFKNRDLCKKKVF
ncbi:Hypothetical protein CINCED_3A018230 [Cinara cedri]|uniref:Uncharacterized protein n=1 Tax=Cinara cedri TaxID=506608 RepID=A0A5E4NPR1_9HEMI|nr:Hypothetical protein CINCED_3A018230 [Cinara cedri]